MISIGISGDWETGLAELKKLGRRELREPILAGLEAAAKAGAAALRETIKRGYEAEPLSGLTLVKRGIGKTKGKEHDAIPPYASSRPLSRSGLMAFAVDYVKQGESFVVGFREGFYSQFSGSAKKRLPVDEIASIIENGVSITLEVTSRMQTYLRVLAGDDITPTGTGENKPTGRKITVTIPKRPFFTRTFFAIEQAAYDAMAKGFLDKLAIPGWEGPTSIGPRTF